MSDEQFRFKVNLGGMIDILANHLYSSPVVYIRELLQNGVDAITARSAAEPDWHDGAITMQLREGTSLSFRDNGIGLTEDEIHEFLAIIGQSSKNGSTSGVEGADSFIGRFGIGMLSCFMVSDEIIIRTRSAKNGESREWHGRPDGTYTIAEPSEPFETGTEVYLVCKPGCHDYFTSELIREYVNYYGVLLPYPIILDNGERRGRLNRVELPWDTSHFDREEVMSFGTQMFNEEFLDCIPLYSEKGGVSGVAYIVSYRVQPSAKTHHRIFLKNMLLTEDADGLLPDWAVFVKCIINCQELRPTASREGFYHDDTLTEAGKCITSCISCYLTDIAQNRPSLFSRILSTHELCIKSIAVDNEELFRIFFDYFSFETTFGSMNGKQLRQYGKPIVYTPLVDRFKNLSQIFFARDCLLVNAGYVFDRQLLERMGEIFDVPVSLLKDDTAVQVMNDVSADDTRRCSLLLKTAAGTLEPQRCRVELKRFSPSQLPAFYMLGDAAQFLREIVHSRENSDEMFSEMLDAFSEQLGIDEDAADAKFYLNLNNPIIEKLAASDNTETISAVIELLYVQTLLIGRYPLQNNEMGMFNSRLLELIDDIL